MCHNIFNDIIYPVGGFKMKMIQAIIKPFKLDDVKEALKSVGVTGMTVSEVKGFGRQKGHTEVYRGAEYEIEFIPKIQLDIAVSDDKVDDVVKAIQSSANTNKIGDGKIFVFSVEQAIRIRTGETGDSAV